MHKIEQKAQNRIRIENALANLPMSLCPTVDDHIKALCDVVREVAFGLQLHLGPGHLEKIYENGLCHRLTTHGIPVERQAKLEVRDDDGFVLGEYFADLLVCDCLIVELKATETMAKSHIAQLMGYLAATRIRHGLLINFGTIPLGIRKLVH